MIREEMENQTPPSPGQKRLWRSTTITEQESPIQSGSVWPGWERVILRVPEHLRAMSVMPKRATWPPWAAVLSVELDKHSSDVGVPKGGS